MRGGRYSPGAPSALTQIVPYLFSLYTVFHSVIYNSVPLFYEILQISIVYTDKLVLFFSITKNVLDRGTIFTTVKLRSALQYVFISVYSLQYVGYVSQSV